MLPNQNLQVFNPALEIDLLRSICKNNFYRFVQEFWPIIIPEKPVWNWHIEYLCWELQNLFADVEAGRPKKHNLIINLAPGSSKCEVGENDVFTPQGYVRIKDLDLGDEVYSYDFDTRQLVKRKIISTGSHYADCFEVSSDIGETATYSWNHPFYTQRGWVYAADLKPTDYVCVFCDEVETNEAIPDDELVFITMMLFEGGTTSGNKTFTNFTPEVVDVMRKACENLGFALVERAKDIGFGQFSVRDNLNWTRKDLGHAPYGFGPAKRLLQKYGIDDCLAKNKRLPKQFFTMPHEQKSRFLGLMVATDGFISKTGGIVVSLASEGLVKDIKRLLAGMGISSSMRHNKSIFNDKKAGKIYEGDVWSLHIHSGTCEKLYRQIDCLHKQNKIVVSHKESLKWYYPVDFVLRYIKNGRVEQHKSALIYYNDVACCRDGKSQRLGIRVSRGGNFTKISHHILKKLLPYEPQLQELIDTPFHWSSVDVVKPVGQRQVYHIGLDADKYDNQNYFSCLNLLHNSSLFSILFPAFVWCRMPSCRFITASFSNELAEGFARKSKIIFKSDLYQKCFGKFRFFPDRAGFYRNQYGGERMSYTTGTSPTGQHAHFILVDDPVDPLSQDRETAIRNINTWMHRVIRTRVVDATISPFILIMQRLSVDDPTGEWLEHVIDPASVKHISLPASIESGQLVKPPGLKKFYKNGLFDPVRLPYSVLAERKNDLGDFDYKAQFDQNPLPKEGLMFKVQKLHIKQLEEFDPIKTKVRYWDKAISTSVNACFTVGCLMGRTVSGKFVIMDIKRGQWDAATRERVILDTAKADGPDVAIGIEQEPGPIWEEELVLLGNGTQIPLKDVRKGDWVVNQFGDATRVLEVHIQGDRLCRKIVSGYHGQVWAALDHPFITPNGDIPAGELKLCDPIYIMEGWEKVEDMVAACNQEQILPCRCLTVDKGESFVVNDFVVHNSGGIESALYTVKNLAGFKVVVDRASQSKEARAEPLAIQVDYGNVSLLEGNWNTGFLSEISSFPRGRLKDQVDAAVGAFRLLAGAQKRTAGPLFDYGEKYSQ